MVNAILEAGGKKPVTRTAPASAVKMVGIILENLYGFLKIKKEPPMTRFVAEELATAHWFNISKAKNDSGEAGRRQPRGLKAQGMAPPEQCSEPLKVIDLILT